MVTDRRSDAEDALRKQMRSEKRGYLKRRPLFLAQIVLTGFKILDVRNHFGDCRSTLPVKSAVPKEITKMSAGLENDKI